MSANQSVTPVLRILDEGKAREFYIGFLGFAVEFEHRFGDNFPIYLGISRDGCILHLTEHHGDAMPGAHVRVRTNNLTRYCAQLIGTNYKFAKPSVGSPTPWGTIEMTITDPFGNRLTYFQPV